MEFKKNFLKESTFELINWADVVVNTFSSVAIDVLLLNKVLVIPKFYFSTYTMFEKYESCIQVNDQKDLMKCLNFSINEKNPRKFYSPNKVSAFMKNIVYNNCTSEKEMFNMYKQSLRKILT